MHFSSFITSVLVGLAAAAENYDVGVSFYDFPRLLLITSADAAPRTLANLSVVGLQRGVMQCEFGRHQVYRGIRKCLSPNCALLGGL